MSSLATYLANNYLTPEPTRPKKRRKKEKSASAYPSGLTIAEDDDDLRLSAARNRAKQHGDDDEYNPTLEGGGRSAEFRPAKKNNWRTVATDNAPAAPEPDADRAVADRILAEAADDHEARRRQVEGEDGPTVAEVVTQGGAEDTETAQPKRAGGLQTAADTARIEAAAARQAAESRSSSKKKDARKAAAAVEAEETVYRDATGRRIDVSMKRAEAREAAEEKRRQERRDKEAAMGEVQLKEKQDKKQALEDAKFLGVARYADDESLNEEMKGVGRWGDPMLDYVRDQERTTSSSRKDEDGVAAVASGKTLSAATATATLSSSTTSRTNKKKHYQGAAPPNRYGILAGWRWDGVDRGNGFEEEWFQARSRKTRNQNLEYEWQMDE